MDITFEEFKSDAYFRVSDHRALLQFKEARTADYFTFIWTQKEPAQLTIDGLPVTMAPHSILALTPIQFVQYHSGEDLIVYQFNREFYCIKDHDKEVSCVGLLFFGNTTIPLIELSNEQKDSYALLHRVFLEEFDNSD